jgi:hypothetical protein
MLALFTMQANAQTDANAAKDSTQLQKPEKKEEKKEEKKWFESISLRGYTQIRYNRLFETNEDLKCEQCDRSWGKEGGFFIRRMRLIFFGQINKRVYFYVQPDMASAVSSTSWHFAQLRDAYFDVGIDAKNRFRFRFGQSKIPFGFENLQSSQNRLPLDRADALNSALSNERDLGLMFYWAPTAMRTLFSELVRSGLKGSGDYGVVGLGVYNGQTANKPDLNDESHLAARVSVPIKIGSQIIEPGVQGYSGRFVIAKDQTTGGTKIHGSRSFLDQRVATTFVLYPKPFGILAEYNWGRGPQFNKWTDSIETKNLRGGFVTFSYMQKIGDQILIPFVRLQHYEGGKKHELDARSYRVEEYEIGLEWQPLKQFELVAMYTISSRRFEDFAKQNNLQEGRLLRLQAQLNF